MESFQSSFGRKLRLGLVGGGPGSFIGPVHRLAANMSNCYEIVAGSFSSKAEKSLAFAEEIGVQRAYPNWQALIQAESKREDGAEVLAIMTPNDIHFPVSMAALHAGMHVICDKPLCNELSHAQELIEAVAQREKVYCVTYNYSAYPMVRQAKAMIAAGDLGEIHQLHVQYVQGYMANANASAGWRGNTAKGGPSHVVGDIATHAYHLVEFVTGLRTSRLMADIGSTVPNRLGEVDDYITCMFNYENGAKGNLWVTNAAAGGEHGLSFKIFGEKGGLEWHQENPNELRHRQLNGFEQILTRRKDGMLYPAAESAMQLVIGHPEGFHDAFSQLYREVAIAIMKGTPKAELPFPTVEDGARGVAFVYKALESSDMGRWVEI